MLPKNIPLNSLKKGQAGKIVQIKSQGDLGRRIRDMGLVVGMPVTILGRAPMGDPLALRVAETTLALRKHEAESILVSF